MIKRDSILFWSTVLLGMYSCSNETKMPQKLTGINTLSYTDVTYVSTKDTVIISTYSGRISKRINGLEEEQVITQLNDEIYSLSFSKKRNEIIASTMTGGVVILGASSGKVKKTLSTGTSWINSLNLSSNGKFLMGYNGQRKNFVWNVEKNYEPVNYPSDFPNCIVRFGKGDNLYHSGVDQIILWNPEKASITTKPLSSGRLVDADMYENTVQLSHHEFVINLNKDSTEIIGKHPNWPYYYARYDTIIRIPYNMQLTTARFAKQTLCTGGIDRSVRFWDVTTGKLKDELLAHRATISSIDISEDETQVVSVDLKGGVHFTNLN